MSAQECSPLQSQFPEVSEEEIERRLAYVQTIIEELTSNAITAPTPIISVEDDQPAHPFSGVTIYPDGSRVPLSPRPLPTAYVLEATQVYVFDEPAFDSDDQDMRHQTSDWLNDYRPQAERDTSTQPDTPEQPARGFITTTFDASPQLTPESAMTQQLQTNFIASFTQGSPAAVLRILRTTELSERDMQEVSFFCNLALDNIRFFRGLIYTSYGIPVHRTDIERVQATARGVLDWIDNPTRYEDTAPVPQVTIDVPSREVDPDLERAQSVSDLLFVVKNILRHGARVIDECPEIEGYPYYPELLREYQRNPIRLRRRVSRLNDKHAMKQELQDAEQLVINSDGTEKD